MSSAPDPVDLRHLRRALDLAARAWGETHPNPMVGAVVAEGEGVLGEGWHTRAGEPHAEIQALAAAAGQDLSRATLYITLEPCCTHGRTPPCTEAILRSGVPRVVVGATDPNPAHRGRGLEILRAAGRTVEAGLLAEDCADLNLVFHHRMERDTPLLAGKIATTLDGRIATRTGDSRWITNASARADVMRWRRYFPAIAVGAGTVLADQPRLTSRRPGCGEWCPVRFVFDRRLRTARLDPPPALYRDEFAARTIVVVPETAPAADRAALAALGVGVWALPATPEAAWPAFRQRCRAEGLWGVLCEGGAGLLGDLLRGGALDYLLAYRAPLLLADEAALGPGHAGPRPLLASAWRLERTRTAEFGDNQLIRGFLSGFTEAGNPPGGFSP